MTSAEAECWGWEIWGDTATDPVEEWDTGRGPLIGRNTQFPPDVPFATLAIPTWRCGERYGGAFSSCGLTQSGQVVCWGPDDYGVASEGNWTEVVVDPDGVCALDVTGTLQCWGWEWVKYGWGEPDLSGLTNLGGECGGTLAIREDRPAWGPAGGLRLCKPEALEKGRQANAATGGDRPGGWFPAVRKAALR